MTYCEAIRKVFTPKPGLNLHEAKVAAHQADYEALSYNGEVWVRHERKWAKTPFKLSDFLAS